MIFFDVTKTGAAGHRSGLTRVSEKLRASLGAAATPVNWLDWDRRAQSDDWFFTAELFSEEERPGLTAFLEKPPCRTAALFHDAIPLKHPHITWPQSVARHPGYMKLLARFARVWAVSTASRDELIGFWRWQGIAQPPPVEVLALGADFDSTPRATQNSSATAHVPGLPSLLCVGILEPRKNQSFLLGVCEELWRGGLAFELHLVGRVNPHFGAPVVAEIKKLQRQSHAQLHFHEAASDALVTELYTRARATVFPTMAEGCGLPLLESLWRGVPCVCTDLPVLRENADAGGCLAVALNDHAAWHTALRRILTDDALHRQLAAAATSRALPTWAQAAETLSRELR